MKGIFVHIRSGGYHCSVRQSLGGVSRVVQDCTSLRSLSWFSRVQVISNSLTSGEGGVSLFDNKVSVILPCLLPKPSVETSIFYKGCQVNKTFSPDTKALC